MSCLGDAAKNKQTNKTNPKIHPVTLSFTDFARLSSHMVEFEVPLLGKAQM